MSSGYCEMPGLKRRPCVCVSKGVFGDFEEGKRFRGFNNVKGNFGVSWLRANSYRTVEPHSALRYPVQVQ